MNSNPTDSNHPVEEDLMAFALGEGKKEIAAHVQGCDACSKTVEEFRSIGKKIASLDDEEVPARVEQRVLKLSHHAPVHGHGTQNQFPSKPRLIALITNPVVIALLVMGLVAVLYFLVGAEVFRVP